MYFHHPSFTEPADAAIKLWRYLDFTKFVSLIDKKALFFVKADKLEDPFEGALTKQNQKKPGFKPTRGAYRQYFFINSWHMNEYESAAMWKLYLKSEEGVAIQTTFNKLSKSFNKYKEEDDVSIGLIKYTDYENEVISEGNLFDRFLHKRKSFEHEKEVRAMMLVDKYYDKQGTYVKVDLNLMIEKVYISPYSKEWFVELVQSVSKRYKLKAEVVKSSLTTSPIF